jgi:hypothetical protein
LQGSEEESEEEGMKLGLRLPAPFIINIRSEELQICVIFC